MTQWVKALGYKSGELSLTPEPTEDGKNFLTYFLVPNRYILVCVPVHTHTCTHTLHFLHKPLTDVLLYTSKLEYGQAKGTKRLQEGR